MEKTDDGCDFARNAGGFSTAVGLRPCRAKCVLLDLDETLIDSFDLIVESYRNVAREYLCEDVSREELLKLDLGAPALVVLEKLLEQRQLSSSELTHNMRDRFRLLQQRDHDKFVRLFDGVTQVLDELKSRGYLLGVVTSKPSTLARMSLMRFSLSTYFHAMVFQEDTEAHKPDPAPIIEALRRLRDSTQQALHARDALYVGDAPADIEAGASAGTYTAAAIWGLPRLGREGSCPKLRAILDRHPTYVLTSVKELLVICTGR